MGVLVFKGFRVGVSFPVSFERAFKLRKLRGFRLRWLVSLARGVIFDWGLSVQGWGCTWASGAGFLRLALQELCSWDSELGGVNFARKGCLITSFGAVAYYYSGLFFMCGPKFI